MIRTAADLLDEFRKKEAKMLDKQEITHAPTIGKMYEGLAKEILGRTFPKILDLRVTSGFIRNKNGEKENHENIMWKHILASNSKWICERHTRCAEIYLMALGSWPSGKGVIHNIIILGQLNEQLWHFGKLVWPASNVQPAMACKQWIALVGMGGNGLQYKWQCAS